MSNTSSETKSTSSIYANCGKGGTDVTNTCNKCKSVMYCNAACKKKHRHKHKEACERRVAEQHDEKLFEQPPPLEDCPICFLRLPSLSTGKTYICHVVGKLFVMVVFMHLSMMTKAMKLIMKSVRFAELQHLLHTMRTRKGTRIVLH